MVKKLVQHGNSAAIIIDKPILELLNVDMNTPLEITTDGKNLIISPKFNNIQEHEILNSLERINKKHGKTLKKLAK
jgi:antitoxin MazE